MLPFTKTQKDEDKSRKDSSEDFALKMEVKVDPLEFQIKHENDKELRKQKEDQFMDD